MGSLQRTGLLVVALMCFSCLATEEANSQDDNDRAFELYKQGQFVAAGRAYKTAAEAGSRLAQFNYSMMMLRGEVSGAKADAIEWLRRSAAQRLPQAEYNLGLLYETGRGVDRSQQAATTWFARAAEQGHTQAAVSLATQYFLGRGTKKSLERAAHWYRVGAEGGDVTAQYILASFYEHGYGVRKELKLAFLWYVAASRQGDVVAGAKARALAGQLEGD
jgi:TPR repeat protein